MGNINTREPEKLKRYFNASELEMLTTMFCLGGFLESKVLDVIPTTSLYTKQDQQHLLAATHHIVSANYNLVGRMDKTQIKRAMRSVYDSAIVVVPHKDVPTMRRELKELNKKQTIDRELLEELYVGISGSLCQGCTIKDHHRCKLKKALLMADAPMYDEYAQDTCPYAFEGNTDKEDFLLEGET